MIKPFTFQMYLELINLMADAGLENADDHYRTIYAEVLQNAAYDLESLAQLDFLSNFKTQSCVYQDLIDQAYSNEWGSGVTLTKEQAIEVLQNMEQDRFNAAELTIMCKEYGQDDPDNEGLWAGLDPTEHGLLSEDIENYYHTFVLIR